MIWKTLQDPHQICVNSCRHRHRNLQKFCGRKERQLVFTLQSKEVFEKKLEILFALQLVQSCLKLPLDQYKGLCHVYMDYDSSYDDLLNKAGMSTIDLLAQKTMLVEIFKSLHGIGAEYLADLFTINQNNTRSEGINLTVPRVDSTTYGLHSIRYHGTILWASLPSEVKSTKDLTVFKAGLAGFRGIKCKCKACKSSS